MSQGEDGTVPPKQLIKGIICKPWRNYSVQRQAFTGLIPRQAERRTAIRSQLDKLYVAC